MIKLAVKHVTVECRAGDIPEHFYKSNFKKLEFQSSTVNTNITGDLIAERVFWLSTKNINLLNAETEL